MNGSNSIFVIQVVAQYLPKRNEIITRTNPYALTLRFPDSRLSGFCKFQFRSLHNRRRNISAYHFSMTTTKQSIQIFLCRKLMINKRDGFIDYFPDALFPIKMIHQSPHFQ